MRGRKPAVRSAFSDWLDSTCADLQRNAAIHPASQKPRSISGRGPKAKRRRSTARRTDQHSPPTDSCGRSRARRDQPEIHDRCGWSTAPPRAADQGDPTRDADVLPSARRSWVPRRGHVPCNSLHCAASASAFAGSTVRSRLPCQIEMRGQISRAEDLGRLRARVLR
jgi:hypothetical protein